MKKFFILKKYIVLKIAETQETFCNAKNKKDLKPYRKTQDRIIITKQFFILLSLK